MYSCPSCDRNFDSSQGMKLHHTRTHGESIAGEIVICDNCGDSRRRKPSHINERNFCDTECKAEWQRENISGDSHPLYSKIETECKNCGKPLKRKKCREGKNHFCNQICQGEWRSNNLTGEDSWAYKDGSSLDNYYNTPEWKQFRRKMLDNIETDCAICGDSSGRQNALHHIIRMGEFERREDANFTENVVFLCQSHHMQLENKSVKEQIEMLNTVSHVPNTVDELAETIDEQRNGYIPYELIQQ